jgi:hypothetical protein
MKGIKFEDLIRFYGASVSVPKTDILIQQAMKNGYDVVYIDSEATIDIKDYNKLLKKK